jgi:phage terminase Nu1 subunit (DNA packaging protein)
MSNFEIVDDHPPPSRRRHTHGGEREGAGRKPAGYEKPQEKQDFDVARARHEAAKADLAEIEVKVKSGEWVSRSAVRQACATAFAAIAQGLRSIPDNLERKLGISGDIAEEVAGVIDEALNDLSDQFELMTGSDDA